jgi:hypothetical protein
MSRFVLDYKSPEQARAVRGSLSMAIMSMLCPTILIGGMVIQEVSIAVLGLLLLLVGVGFGIASFFGGRGPRSAGIVVLATLGVVENGSLLALIYWAVFVHGIC